MIVDSTHAKTGEQFRPAFHFTPKEKWMNDPNGMVYYKEEYHLFYQYYPDDNVWGPMHWGHAVSKDMIHWEHLPIALYPDKLGYIFSGSCVIDWNNTSGFGSKENPPMVAIFTYHDPEGEKAKKIDFQTQGIAYSLDKGRTWTKYNGNPVIPNPGIKDFRDPKVSWHAKTKKWVMSLAVKDHISFYSSNDLKDWNFESDFGAISGAHGGVWECPDLFSLKDQYGNEQWILLVSINPNGPQGGSATQYFVGDFDGKTFTPNHKETKWIDYGADNYAGVTFSDIPAEDGRRLFIGWMSNWQYAQVVPTYTWRSAMTLPRELLLNVDQGNYTVFSKPVIELENILGASQVVETEQYESKSSSFVVQFKANDEQGMISLYNNLGEVFSIEMNAGLVTTNRTQSGDGTFSKEFAKIHKAKRLKNPITDVKLFVDASSVELFINDGELVMTELLFPTEPLKKIAVTGTDQYKVSEVKSIWNQNKDYE
jgi:fructan beta-fructosidase